jgi:hypothetical protein
MDRTDLLKWIREKFNDNELRDLCFELDIDYESLPGEGKAAKVRELVTYCQRRDRLVDLEQVAQRMHAKSALSQSGSSAQGGQIDASRSVSIQGNAKDNIIIVGDNNRVNAQRMVDNAATRPASSQDLLAEARENLRLIEERKAQYVQEVDIPLQLIREERRLRQRIKELEQEIGSGPQHQA